MWQCAAVEVTHLIKKRERDPHAVTAVHRLPVGFTAGSDPEHHGGAGGPLGRDHDVIPRAGGDGAVGRPAAAQPLGETAGLSKLQSDQVAAVDEREPVF